MKAKLINYEIKNLLEELGTDMSVFHLFFQVENKPITKVPFIVGYDSFHNFFEEHNIEIYDYLTKVRNSIGGYGLKHKKVIKIIMDEEFDFETHLQNFLNHYDDSIFEKHYAHEKLIDDPNIQVNAQKMLEDFDSIIDDEFISYNIKIDDFTDELDQTIHELTLKYFPELFEMGEESIMKYKDQLCRTTIQFVEKIDDIMNQS